MKKSYRPPKKKGTLAQRIAAEKRLRKAIENRHSEETKARLRIAWAFVVSMAETDGVELTPEQIADVVDGMSSNMVEYDAIRARDGEDVADTKLYMRVCEVLGQDPSECDYRHERLFDYEPALEEVEDEEW